MADDDETVTETYNRWRAVRQSIHEMSTNLDHMDRIRLLIIIEIMYLAVDIAYTPAMFGEMSYRCIVRSRMRQASPKIPLPAGRDYNVRYLQRRVLRHFMDLEERQRHKSDLQKEVARQAAVYEVFSRERGKPLTVRAYPLPPLVVIHEPHFRFGQEHEEIHIVPQQLEIE
ncbi:unnamed protein product [Caenorhabditis bovis]|uniref:Uncharacterized protein n=1 Tax=Caenorhabditis bovis TaxID=2654633 RepID=A0A8S1EQM0_9PELO|nr:unnamed protein product [Caenorhabditis bovis]